MKSPFTTTDMYLASTLVALGYALIDVDRSTLPRARFLFVREAGIENVINGFYDDSITLPPQKLFAAQKAVKTRLYAQGNGHD